MMTLLKVVITLLISLLRVCAGNVSDTMEGSQFAPYWSSTAMTMEPMESLHCAPYWSSPAMTMESTQYAAGQSSSAMVMESSELAALTPYYSSSAMALSTSGMGCDVVLAVASTQGGDEATPTIEYPNFHQTKKSEEFAGKRP